VEPARARPWRVVLIPSAVQASAQSQQQDHPAGERELLPSTAAVNEPQNDQKQNGTDCGGNNGGNDPSAEMDSQLGEQPTADQGADDPNADVSNETVSGASYNMAGQPSRDEADEENDDKTFG
jgi:hypothetical protein